MSTPAPTHVLPDVSPIPKGRIGRFIVEREIGQGSVGAVYLFRDPLIGRKIAIKILNPQLPAEERRLFEKHFIQEARAAGRLNHPNIVTVYDADKTDDLLFIAMEYLEGQELRDMLATGHQFSFKQIADVVARIANALDYAHQHGVIHRDIKPANIFIVGKSTPKVLDFGIASASRQLTDPDVTLGQNSVFEQRLIGTPSYMSPEQARREQVDARTDIYSLGVVLYQLLCGQLPFKADSIDALLGSITRDAPIPPQEIRADVPLRLAAIAARALAKKPEDRYARAADMANDLNRFISKERTNQIMAQMQKPGEDGMFAAAGNSTDKSAAIVQPAAPSRWPLLIGFALAAAAAVLTLITWTVLRSPPVQPVPIVSVAPAPPVVKTESVVAASVAASIPKPAEDALANSLKANESVVPLPVVEPPKETVVAKKPDPASAQKAASKSKNKPVPTDVVAPVVMGSVQIAVAPWGEVFVDGSKKGVAPPLSRLSLPVGSHRIEIRNGEDNYAVTIEINADKEAKVGHRF